MTRAMDPDPCDRCGKLIYCDMPYIINGIRGFKSSPHGCPEEFDHYEFDWDALAKAFPKPDNKGSFESRLPYQYERDE